MLYLNKGVIDSFNFSSLFNLFCNLSNIILKASFNFLDCFKVPSLEMKSKNLLKLSQICLHFKVTSSSDNSGLSFFSLKVAL